jgi:hypothetical protein
MNRIITLFLLSLWSLVTATLLPAQTASPRKTASSSFLLVVDTSFSMAPQKAVLCITAHELIYGGIRDQMKPGDTFSLWTFNQDTDTQQFPVLEWNPDRKVFLANQVSVYLNNQPFQKISRLDKALPEILGLTRDSRKLTVLILSDGLEFFQGTPFDVSINEVYRERSRELRQAGKPFITLLQAMDGQIVGWSVAGAVEAIQFSQLQAPVQSAPAVANSEAPPDRRGSGSDVVNSGPVQSGLAKAPKSGVAKPNLIVRSLRPKDEANSSSPAADENAGSSEKIKLQLRVPPQSIEPDSSRLNLALSPPIVFTRPANSSAPPNPSERTLEAPSATSVIAVTAPGPALSQEAVPTPTATRLENSLAKPESFKPSPELGSAALRGEKTGEQKIAPPTEFQGAPAQPNETATSGPQTSAKPRQSKVEYPSARAALPPAQADQISVGKIKQETTLGKSIPAPPHPLTNVPSAANSKAEEPGLSSSNSRTGAQVALLAPGATYQFQWGYFALGLTSLLTALGLIYLLTRRTRAPQRSSLISRSIERK